MLVSDIAGGGTLEEHALDRRARQISHQLTRPGRSDGEQAVALSPVGLVPTNPGRHQAGSSAFLHLPIPQRLEAMRLLASHLAEGGSLAEQALDRFAGQILMQSAPACGDVLGMITGKPVEPELQVLQRYGVLEEAVRRRLVKGLIDSVKIDSLDAVAMHSRSADFNLDTLRLKVWIKGHYEPLLHDWSLRHRRELETWVYVCLRVQDECLASELYLQASDDGCDLSVLVDRHGHGEGRWTRGVVGPVRAYRVALELRQHLEAADLGQILPPRQVHDDWLILQLLHRFPADPADGWWEAELWDIFQRDLGNMVARVLRQLQEAPISIESAMKACSWQPRESLDLPLLPDIDG